MAVNKVVQSNGTTLIDITPTTAVASDVASGKIFFLADGTQATGTGEGGGSVTWDTLYEGSVTIVSSSPNYIAINNFSETINEDETWRITWDGVEYVCTPQYSSQIGGCFIGNSTIVGGSDSGNNEPFWAYKRTSTQLAFSTNQSAGTITLVVERQTTSSATLITKTITANGTYSASDDDADGYSSVTVNVPSGGASNLVTGTFTGTTTGTAMDIVLPYTGNGYPIAVVIYPSRSAVSTFNSLIQRYVIRDYCADKMNNNEPSYSSTGNANSGYVCLKYKSSASNSTSYSNGGGSGTVNVYNDTSATASSTLPVQIRSKTKMSVFIASTSYGFAANIEYTYRIVYSE